MTEQEARNQLMDYLYNEMDENEKNEFEKFLKTHPALQKELEEFQSTRKIMQGVSLDSPEEQPDFIPKRITADEQKSTGRTATIFRILKYGAVAASLILVSVATLAFSSVQVGKTSDGFYLTMGAQPEPVQPGITEEDVIALLNQIRQENTVLMATLAEQTQQQQNEQLEEALNLLTEYYDQRRQQDLLLIAKGLSQLEEDTYSRFRQTDETLGNLIYALSNP